MAFSIGEISANITADDGKFSASMNEIRKKGARAADTIEQKFQKVGQRMRRIGAGMTAAITAPLVGVGGMAVKTAADFESLRQSMDILNGSVEEGARNFERLKEFSAETPFQLKNLAEAQNMLQGFGLSADEAFESLSQIGDIAAVASGDIKGIGIAFGQAAAEGRLMTRDIRQLINQGVPAIKLLADTMNVAESEVFDLASEGKISFDILQQAFRDATEEGGMFADGMAKQANTLAGVWSTLKDRVSLALGELGNVIAENLDLKQLAKDIGAGVRQIAKRFENMSEESQTQILKVAGLIGAGGPLLMGLGQAAIAVSAFSKLVRTRFAMITGSAALLAGVIEQQGQLWAKVFGDSEKEVDNFTTSARKGLGKVIGPIIEFTEEALGAGEALDNFRNLLRNLDSTAVQEAKQVLSDTQDVISFINGDVTALNATLSDTTGRVQGTKNESKKVTDEWVALDGAAVTVKQTVDKILSSTAGFKDRMKSIKEILGADLEKEAPDLSKMLLEPGSIQFLNEEMAKLRERLMRLQVGSEAFNIAKEKLAGMKSEMIDLRTQMVTTDDIMQNFAETLGSALQQAIIHGKKLGSILSNVAKQLASKALMTGLKFLMPGGPTIGSASFLGALFGNFHGGGIVSGSGEKPVMAKGGEGIFTKSQMQAMGGMMRSGGPKIDYGKMKQAFQQAFRSEAQKLGPEEVFAMNMKGQNSF